MYSIKAVSQATGLTVETLRAWERRYGVVVPGRDPTGRRVYRADDVLRLRRLREATERGHPIGRLVELSEADIARLLSDVPDRRSRAASGAFVTRILEAACEFRTADCEQALTLAIAMLPPQRLVGEVLQPLLREVGERWHRGELAISQERLVSTVVRRHVSLMLETYDRGARRQAIVFATLPGERHELGLLMSALVCSSRGFKAHYLGPDLPAGEIARYVREVGAPIVALSVVLHEHLAGLPAQLAELAAGLPPDCAVWLGGVGPGVLPESLVPACCTFLPGYADLEQRLDMLAA
jgi:MerR family transcriptional regulator, light-induced transcriptional regulator